MLHTAFFFFFFSRTTEPPVLVDVTNGYSAQDNIRKARSLLGECLFARTYFGHFDEL